MTRWPCPRPPPRFSASRTDDWYPGPSMCGEAPGTVTDRSSNVPRPASEADTPPTGLGAQVRTLTRAIFASHAGKPLITLMVAAVIIVAATAYGQIRLNRWNKPFFDALSARSARIPL